MPGRRTQATDFPDSLCDVGLNDCPTNSICLWADLGVDTGLCARTCASNQECFTGQSCQDIGVGTNVCFPG
jgi:hypothetical protein